MKKVLIFKIRYAIMVLQSNDKDCKNTLKHIKKSLP